MKPNNIAGDVTNELLKAVGDRACLPKKMKFGRELRRLRQRQELRKRRVIATSIPQGKGFQ